MERGIDRYLKLMKQFLEDELTAEQFQRAYLEAFKNEREHFAAPVFGMLDALFGDVDAYTSDPSLLSSRPTYFLTESELRRRVEFVLQALNV